MHVKGLLHEALQGSHTRVEDQYLVRSCTLSACTTRSSGGPGALVTRLWVRCQQPWIFGPQKAISNMLSAHSADGVLKFVLAWDMNKRTHIHHIKNRRHTFSLSCVYVRQKGGDKACLNLAPSLQQLTYIEGAYSLRLPTVLWLCSCIFDQHSTEHLILSNSILRLPLHQLLITGLCLCV